MEGPPVIKARKDSGCLLVLLFAALVIALFAFFVFTRVPPRESKLVQRFNAHRSAYDQLKKLLDADTHVRAIRSAGISMKDGVNIAESRREQYMALLSETGGDAIVQSGDPGNRTIRVFLWHWGWAGLSRNVGISWNDQPPTNQLPVLFGYRPPGSVLGRDVFFKHIDENWYVWADFWRGLMLARPQ